MDQDFYIEESSPLKVILAIIFFLGLIGGGLYYYFNYHKEIAIKLKNVTVELGTKIPNKIEDYIECDNPESYKLDTSSVIIDDNGNTTSTGEYSYKVMRDGKIKKGKIYVKDTIVPNVEVIDLNVGVKENFIAMDFVSKCEDLSLPCSVKFRNINDEKLSQNEGNYNLDIVISDAEGNSITKNVKLIVSGENVLANKKASDLEFNHLSENDPSWDKTYTLKLEKAINENGMAFNETIEDLSLKEYLFDKEISDKKVLVAYNKYNYAIGFSIKYTFIDNTYVYVTSDNAKEKTN